MLKSLEEMGFSNPEGIHPRIHAKNLDRELGYRIPKIEEKLNQKYRHYELGSDSSNRKTHFVGTQTWIGLHPQVLQTPYCDVYKILKLFKNLTHVVDIGSGYGRVGLVLSVLFPKAKFTGYEIVKQRVNEGNRVLSLYDLDNSEIKLEDVLSDDFNLPEADLYFIYDFSEKEDIERTLKLIKSKMNKKKYFLITRGDRIENLLKHQFKHIWKEVYSLGSSDLKVYSSKNV
ncbi:MAG: hypothetical protein GY909_18090 [Oligoflexia bacterium]|nr:hypothetical protein [Oligoflexia bacterium]